jgi:hypothetical protein
MIGQEGQIKPEQQNVYDAVKKDNVYIIMVCWNGNDLF